MYINIKILTVILFAFEAFNCQNLNTTGCPQCPGTWCPKNEVQCPYGLVNDLCECCPNGICAKIEGEDCYDETLVPEPPIVTKKYGSCGKNLKCIYSLTEDEEYTEKDMPNAICVCEDTRMVCASDNKTYNSICDLDFNKIKNGIEEQLTVKNYGPCASVPKITVKPMNITTTINDYVLLNCEVRGFPIPEITWDFVPYPGKGTKIKLPSDVLDIAVQTRGGPESFMVTSWIQILHLRKTDAGIYNCIATNVIGNSTAYAVVTVKDSMH